MTKATYILEKSANIEDLATGEATEELVFRKVGGGLGRLALRRSELQNATHVKAALLDRNAKLPRDAFADDLIKEAVAAKPQKLIGKAKAYGWQRRGRAFVHPAGVIEHRQKGEKGPRRALHQPGWINAKHTLTQKRRSTAELWTEHVASKAVHSSAATIAICAACAAPLLKLTGMQSFGLNFYGISKAGKTTALLAGSSFAGIGVESGLPNHRATSGAKLELARLFNDQMLPINEVGLLAGKKKDAYGHLRDLVYNLSEGRDRLRMTQTETAVAAYCAEFRIVFVSTAEHSFDRYAAFAGETRDDGEFARCTDVAAAFNGRRTIMDRLKVKGPARRKRQAARAATIALRKACRRYYGAAFEHYINHLMLKGDKLKKKISAHISVALAALKDPSLDGARQHAIGNFALLYAGGALAIEAGLLPLKKQELLSIITGAFRRATEGLTAEESPKKAMRLTLRHHLKTITSVPASGCFRGEEKKPYGFREEHDGKTRYTIASKAFRNWFGKRNADVDLALDWLHSKNVLQLKNSRRKQDYTDGGIDWAITTPKWPPVGEEDDSKRSTRSIVFFDPFAK
ncbi:MAG: DUF927 domain-containing protein [Bosea sp. (in: a-proteobacteria)]